MAPTPSDASRAAPAARERERERQQPLRAAPVQPWVAPERPRTWPVWITVSVGALALVAVGYLTALVQLGAAPFGRLTPRLVSHQAPPPESIQPEVPARNPRESAPAPAWTAAEPKTVARTRAHVATTGATTWTRPRSSPLPPAHPTPEREVHPPQPPVITIRPLTAGSTSLEQPAPVQPLASHAAVGSEPSTRPSREDVQRGLAALRSQLEACAAGRHGMIETQVTIAANGRVTYGLIHGAFAGTPEGSCMARALRSATFPAFSGPSFKVLFPYSL